MLAKASLSGAKTVSLSSVSESVARIASSASVTAVTNVSRFLSGFAIATSAMVTLPSLLVSKSAFPRTSMNPARLHELLKADRLAESSIPTVRATIASSFVRLFHG